MTHSWSRKNEPLNLGLMMMDDKMTAPIVCIEKEVGLKLLMNLPKSVDSIKNY